MFKLALDAGHGLYTPGKRCLKSLDPKETREWVLNARICEKICDILEAYSGIEVMRVDDTTGQTDIPLATRTNVANDWGADLYLSVHHDAGIGGGIGGGASVIAYTSASEKSLECQRQVNDCFYASVGKFGNRANTMPKMNLHVLRETKMPAVLIECGFMDSKTDVPRILSEDFANKAARGLADAVVKIAGLKKKGEEQMAECKFQDIKGHYAEKQIKEVFEMGIMNGVSDTEFQPDKPLTRGQAAIVARNIVRYVTGK